MGSIDFNSKLAQIMQRSENFEGGLKKIDSEEELNAANSIFTEFRDEIANEGSTTYNTWLNAIAEGEKLVAKLKAMIGKDDDTGVRKFDFGPINYNSLEDAKAKAMKEIDRQVEEFPGKHDDNYIQDLKEKVNNCKTIDELRYLNGIHISLREE